jgi:sirohydrochlorin cobaltochelatase
MPQWSHSSLLLVAHGSSRYPQAAADLLRLAKRLDGFFARIDVAFWRQPPELTREHLKGKSIFVLPYFAGAGKHTDELIPERLGLSGSITRRDGAEIRYCQPIGANPRLPSLILNRARHGGLDLSASALLLIAHGSSHQHASRTPEAIAGRLRDYRAFAEVKTVYLEQEPYARDWRKLVKAKTVIAQPLLLAAGMHASEDLPALLGDAVHLRDGIGSDEEILAMMIDQIEEVS